MEYKTEDVSEEGAEDKGMAMGALEEDLAHLRPGVRGHIARRRAQGLTLRERIFELHVGQGLPLVQVARALGVSLHLVSYHWLRLQKQIIANAPRSPDDFAVLRERIGAMLWQTIQLTCPASDTEASAFALRASSTAARASSFVRQATEDKSEAREAGPVHADADGGVGAKASAPVARAVPAAALSAPLLVIHLRALEQLARLYDLGLDNRTTPDAVRTYASPEEVAASAHERMLELHVRSEK